MKPNFQNSTAAEISAAPVRRLLEQTRLSRLPSQSNAAFCVNCQTKLTADNRPLQSAKICRRCMTAYAVIDLELTSASERKARSARLAKMQGKLSLQK
jgi:hypothetical protein